MGGVDLCSLAPPHHDNPQGFVKQGGGPSDSIIHPQSPSGSLQFEMPIRCGAIKANTEWLHIGGH